MFLAGSSPIRAVFIYLVTRTRDEKPHRHAKGAYLCATRSLPSLPSAGNFSNLTSHYIVSTL